MAQVAVRNADRVVIALGTALGADPSWSIEDLTTEREAAVDAALAQVVGDGAVTLSPDHQAITILPPSAAWTAASTRRQALLSYLAQHQNAIQSLYDQIAATSSSFANDLQSANTIIQAWIGGTPPTEAQSLVLIRVMIRIMVFEAAGRAPL